jgi:hypothetical protein
LREDRVHHAVERCKETRSRQAAVSSRLN